MVSKPMTEEYRLVHAAVQAKLSGIKTYIEWENEKLIRAREQVTTAAERLEVLRAEEKVLQGFIERTS